MKFLLKGGIWPAAAQLDAGLLLRIREALLFANISTWFQWLRREEQNVAVVAGGDIRQARDKGQVKCSRHQTQIAFARRERP